MDVTSSYAANHVVRISGANFLRRDGDKCLLALDRRLYGRACRWLRLLLCSLVGKQSNIRRGRVARHDLKSRCPLYTRKQTLGGSVEMSAKCQ